ncbi:28335_t:CDS:1, partial [Gigaspora margarita]
MSRINLAVTHLQVHLPKEQQINYNEDYSLAEVITDNYNQRISLTEYFKINAL